jgi:hypothetical protein
MATHTESDISELCNALAEEFDRAA